MRILMVCADWGVSLQGHAGSSVHFRSLAEALAVQGHEMRLIVSNASGTAHCRFPSDTVPFRQFWPALRGFVEHVRGHSVAQALDESAPKTEATASLTRKAPPTEMPPPSWKTRLYYQGLPRFLDRAEELLYHRRRFARTVARVVAEFSPHALYERYALGQTGAARAIRGSGKRDLPHLLEVNASLASERSEQGSLPGLWSWWSHLEERRQWRQADRVFCVSSALRDTVLSAGIEPRQVIVTPNGVDVDVFSPNRPQGALRRRLGLMEHNVLVGWLGSLSPGRGAEEFLRILALVLPQAPEVRGVIIGGGILAPQLQLLADELGVTDRVAFLGAVPHAEVPDLLVDLDVAVASYPLKRGFYFSPMKIIEYLACGLPVVCGRAGQMEELVKDGVDGVLVDPGDLPAWGQAVAALCRDPDLRDRLGLAARASALAGPTWAKNAALVTNEILSLRQERLKVGPH